MAAAPKKPAILDLSYILMRTNPDQQMQRTQEFIVKSVKPALQKAGAGTVGLFTNLIGEDNPRMLVVVSYESLARMEQVEEKLRADQDLEKAAKAFYGHPALPFERLERALLRGFDTMPDIEVPPAREGGGSRIFELRRYESDTAASLATKVHMFDNGEIDIFRRTGLTPVFFGRMIVGTKMPNLTYMIAFDSLADREASWSKFGSHPDWQKLRSEPRYADTAIVSNISNSIFRPVNGSDIR